MTPSTLKKLTDGILRLGYQDEELWPLSAVSDATWKRLQNMGMVDRGPRGDYRLTAKGQKMFTAMEAGGDVPEFTYDTED